MTSGQYAAVADAKTVHRWRLVADLYAYPFDGVMHERVTELVRTFLSAIFPLGVVEGFPDLYDQDERRARIETPFQETRPE